MQKSRTEIKFTVTDPYLDLPKLCMLLIAFFLSRFSYCLLVWVFHRHCKNNKINRLHERCLRIINSGKKSTFIELLERIILSQYMKETHVSLPLRCSNSKEVLPLHYAKKLLLKIDKGTKWEIIRILLYHW